MPVLAASAVERVLKPLSQSEDPERETSQASAFGNPEGFFLFVFVFLSDLVSLPSEEVRPRAVLKGILVGLSHI